MPIREGLARLEGVESIGDRPDLTTGTCKLRMKNGRLLASQIVGPGTGGERINFIVSRDDGKSWNMGHPLEFYNPGSSVKDRLGVALVDAAEAQATGTAGGRPFSESTR